MAFERPSLQDLIDQTKRDFEARLPGADARIHNSLINVIARVHAGALHGMYGYLESVRDNAFLIDPEDEYLELLASRWGVKRITNTIPRGYVFLYSYNETTVPEGAVFYDPTSGRQFVTTDAVTLDYTEKPSWGTPPWSSSYTWNVASIKAVKPGEVDVPEESRLLQIQHIPGLVYAHTYGSFSGGLTIETNDDLMTRLFDRWRRPPMGGTKQDFREWALSADPAVTRAWVLSPTTSNPGVVRVLYAIDTDRGVATPTSAMTAKVLSVVQDNAPILAYVEVMAVTVTKINVTVINESFEGQIDEAQRKFEAAVRDFFKRESEPGGIIRLSRLQEAISSVDGENSHTLQYPTTDLQAGEFEIFDLGSFS